ncbi:PadR family transcriptional regulator [Natrinema hispanicum]|nr:PadR family transcriptional regulator [Natrinema hispanicum]SDC74937.1 Transcriptional regulator PadR-like family protein [Natrinema hispanicum]SEU05250.1 Transcriptional regulator PadR-like family protein [Natrinema hispanicum]
MDDLTGFQRDLLYVIAGADQPSGQDVKDEIETYYSSEINHGRLYPNLDTLVNKDLVEKGQLDRRTNYYEISNRGQQAIEERRQWEQQYLNNSALHASLGC